MNTMSLMQARSLFLGLRDKVFLDTACVGLAPSTAKDAISEFLDLAICCPAKNVSDHHIAMDVMKKQAVKQGALLFNSDEKNIALIESTTHGLNIAANSIVFNKDDEVIICDTEYLQVAIPFYKKHEAGKLKVVPLKASANGHISLHDFEKLLNKNTKAICLSSVQWCTGQRVFSRELGELCRNRGIWLIVDGVQEAGALNVDLNHRYCDFYISGGHKWLNAPYGCGLLYMSARAQELEPQGYGYLNLPDPEGGWGQYFQEPWQTPFRRYDFPKTARSFGIGGTGNYPGAVGLAESLKIVNALGREAVEKQALGLAKLLRDELRKMPVKIVSDFEEPQCSGITIFRLFEDHQQDKKALDFLLEKAIFLSIRYTNQHGGLRASTHYYNNEEDVMRLCYAIRQIKT